MILAMSSADRNSRAQCEDTPLMVATYIYILATTMLYLKSGRNKFCRDYECIAN